MSKMNGLNRRAFLKGASMTALAGAAGTGSTIAAAAPAEQYLLRRDGVRLRERPINQW